MNIYDIATEAGVSPTTVSRVLNEKDNVKDSTRQKVLAVIAGKEYRPNPIAQHLSTGDSRTIAFLAPDIDNAFFSKILHGISDYAYKHDLSVSMYGTDENLQREHRILETLKSGVVRGLIITPISAMDKKTASLLRELKASGIPVVLVDRDIQGMNFDGVFSNDEKTAKEAVRCLIDAGHKKIAIIAGSKTSKPGENRLTGYKEALAEAGIALREEYIVNGFFHEKESYEAAKILMQLPDPPTAVFSSNNLSTLGCLRYLWEQGLCIGKDISLVGFDDIRELRSTNIQLTAVDRPIYEMGYEAMHILMLRFDQPEECSQENYRLKRYTMDGWLIKRGSEKCLLCQNKYEGEKSGNQSGKCCRYY